MKTALSLVTMCPVGLTLIRVAVYRLVIICHMQIHACTYIRNVFLLLIFANAGTRCVFAFVRNAIHTCASHIDAINVYK
jgi:hypothetical protein